MGDWISKELSQIAKITKGQQLNKTCLFSHGDYYVLNGGIEPSGYYDKWNTEANTISISEGGNSCGYVNYNSERFWSGGHCYSLSKINDISTECLFHILKYHPLLSFQNRSHTYTPTYICTYQKLYDDL